MRACYSQSSHHSTKTGVLRHCLSGEIIGLVCLVISEEHVIKGLCHVVCEGPS